MRKINIATPRVSERSFSIESKASTWGELKSELADRFDATGMKGVIRETNTTVEVDDAKLPEGDFTMFIMPKQTKAGSDKLPVHHLLSRDELRKVCSKLNISQSGTKQDMVGRLDEFYKSISQEVETKSDNSERTLVEVAKTLRGALIDVEKIIDDCKDCLPKEVDEKLTREAQALEELVTLRIGVSDSGCDE